MRLLDFFVIMLLFGALLLGSYFLWLNLPTESLEFERYRAEIDANTPAQSTQFYANLRYQDKVINYAIEQNCSRKKSNDVREAFQIIEDESVLDFSEKEPAQIRVICSGVAPAADDRNNFIAGEGGPTRIVNTSEFSVIIEGEVSLFRPDECPKPQIATHEILHALGFDHNNNESSIMYRITKCNQIIDGYIIDEINRLYQIPSLPDLKIQSLDANKSGNNLNFQASISNVGLREIGGAKLVILSEGERIREFEVEEFDVGVRREISVKNLRVPRRAEEITFYVETTEPELTLDNNQVKISIIKS